MHKNNWIVVSIMIISLLALYGCNGEVKSGQALNPGDQVDLGDGDLTPLRDQGEKGVCANGSQSCRPSCATNFGKECYKDSECGCCQCVKNGISSGTPSK